MKTLWFASYEKREESAGWRSTKKTSVAKRFEINSNKWFETTCVLFVHVCACKYGAGVHKPQKCICELV